MRATVSRPNPSRRGRRGRARRRGSRRRSATEGCPSSVQPPMTTSWPGAAFGLGPALAAARLVGRIEPLGDDPLQLHAAGRLQHRVAGGHEVVDVADVGRRVLDTAPAAAPCARSSGSGAQVLGRRTSGRRRRTPGPSVLPSEIAACRAAKSGAPVWSRATTSPSMMPSAKPAPAATISGNFDDQSRPLRVQQCRLAAVDAQLHAVAVELDLVGPPRAGRRLVQQTWPAAARRSPAGWRRPWSLQSTALRLARRASGRPARCLAVALPDRSRPLRPWRS